jgi:hypothetical protein
MSAAATRGVAEDLAPGFEAAVECDDDLGG